MIQFLIGLLSFIFFGGGLLIVFLKDKERAVLNWKYILLFLVLIVGSFLMMLDSNIVPKKPSIMENGNEVFNSNDTIIAGNNEYTVTKIGTESTIHEYGDKIKADGKYVIFKISIKNNSNHPFSMDTISNPPFYLLNEKKLYKVKIDSSRYFTDSKINGVGYWDSSNFINPGNESAGYAIFDVPKKIVKSKETQLLIRTDDSAPNDIYLNIN